MTTPPRLPSSSFDPAAVATLLDGDHAALRARVRGILCRPSFRYLDPAADVPAQREAAYRWCRELADEGLGLLAVPEEDGGQDDFAAFMAAFETVAFHDLGMTIKFTVQFGIFLGSVRLLGNAEQHRRYLRRIGSFDLPGCFALTEIGHGSDARGLETTAIYDPAAGQFVIHSPTWTAGKNYIGNGACHGRLATVFAQLETGGERHGVHAFLVPLRDEAGRILPGVRIEDNGPKMGENGVDNARIWFDQVRVGRDALLNRFGDVALDGLYGSQTPGAGARFFKTISALVGGRISIAAAGLSAAKSGLAIAVRYAARRRQFRALGAAEDTPLLAYPTHRRRLLPLLANAYALDFAHKALVRRYVATRDGRDPAGAREVERLAAGLKAVLTWNTTRTLQTCRECCGGEGYLSVNRLPALKADADIFTTFEGDNTVLMLWVGRQLLADADAAHGGPVQADGALAANARSGRPFTADDGSPRPERDKPEKERSYRYLFAQRAARMIEEVRLNLQGLTESGVDRHEAMSRQQNALFQAAYAHLESHVFEQFTAAALAQPAESGAGAILRRLNELFAVSLLEQHRGWHLENGLLTPAVSKALAGRVDALCAELAPDAEALVNAFGIPEACLAAPIAV